jgi:hypothetical protein
MSTSTTHRHLQILLSSSHPVGSNHNKFQLPYGKRAQQLDCCADSALDDTRTWETAAIHRLLWQCMARVRHLRRASPCVELETRARRGLDPGLPNLVQVTCSHLHNQIRRKKRNPSGVADSAAVSVLTPATFEDGSLGVACQKGRRCGLNCLPLTVTTPGNQWTSRGVTMPHRTTSLLPPALDSLREQSHSTKAGDKACRPDVSAVMVRALPTSQKKTSPTSATK